MFKLYRLVVSKAAKGLFAYAWVNPQGECFTSRDSYPYGVRHSHEKDEFKGISAKELKSYGFKEVRTHGMTQDELSKGYLFLKGAQ